MQFDRHNQLGLTIPDKNIVASSILVTPTLILTITVGFYKSFSKQLNIISHFLRLSLLDK